MKDTYKAITESEIGIVAEANLYMYETLSTLSESQLQLTGYTPDKVVVLLDEDNYCYFIEFDHNIERLMDDRKLSFTEAVSEICMENGVLEDRLKIIVTDRSLDRINISELSEDFTFVKK